MFLFMTSLGNTFKFASTWIFLFCLLTAPAPVPSSMQTILAKLQAVANSPNSLRKLEVSHQHQTVH